MGSPGKKYTGTKSTRGLAKLRGTFSQYSTISGTPLLRERSTAGSKATPSSADSPSAWAYSFRSPCVR